MTATIPNRLVALPLVLLLALPVASCGRGGGATRSLETPAYLPADALVAGTVRFESLAEGFDTVLGMLRSVLPPEELPEIDEGLAELEERLGFRIRDDLLALLSAEASFALGIESIDLLAGQLMGGAMAGGGQLPPGTLEILEDVVLVVGVADEGRLDESLRALLASGGAELRVSEDGLRTVQVPGGEIPVSLHFRHHEGFAVLGVSVSAVDRAIERAEGRTGLDRSADYRALLERLGTDPRAFSYVNLPRIHALLESSTAVQGALAMQEEGERFYRAVVPEEPWSGGQAWGIYRAEGGVATRSFVPRDAYPVPGAFLGNLGSIQMLGVVAAIAVPNFLNAYDLGRHKRTMIDMRAIATGCEQYQIDRKAYPGPTAGLVPVDWLAEHLVPVYIERIDSLDGWGGTLLYWSDGKSYRIVSLGKDGEQDWLPGTPPRGATGSFEADTVFEDGSFVQSPKGRQP